MKNYVTKSEILLDQSLMTQTIMMRNIWKSNFRWWFSSKKTLKIYVVIVVELVFHEDSSYYPQV